MPETIAVNGIDLSTLVRNVESLAGLLGTPPRRGGNLSVPRRHGVLLAPDKQFDPAEFVLPLWVVGADTVTGNNLLGDPAVTAFYARVDEIVALFSGTPTITHTLPGGAVRQAVVEASDILDFTRQLGSPLFGRVQVALQVLGAFWVDGTTSTQTITGATGVTFSLAQFIGATAPMDELTLTFTGAISNPVLTDTVSGRWIAYDGVIAAGRTLVVNCATWALTQTGGLTISATSRRSSHSGRWWELSPGATPATAPQVSLTHTGGGSASVTISGRRKYLTG